MPPTLLWHPDAKDGERIDDRDILQRYRDPKSGLDVLINVEILTQGVDLPMTRTIFLARPTSSEIPASLRPSRGKDLRSSEIETLLVERHTPLARIIYPSAFEFRRAFDDAMRELHFPGEAPPPKGIVLFEPPPSNPLRPGPYHDLPRLFNQMLAKARELLSKPLQHDGPVEWSKRTTRPPFGPTFRP